MSAGSSETSEKRHRAARLGVLQKSHSIRGIWLLLGTGIAVTSGIAQLIISGPGRVVLAGLLAASVVLLTGSIVHNARVRRRRAIDVVIAEKDSQIRSYQQAIGKMAQVGLPNFRERLDVVMRIGTVPEGDRFEHIHRSTPDPYLTYRFIRPFITRDPGTRFEDLRLHAEVDGDPGNVTVLPIPDGEGRLLLLVLFSPGRDSPFEWKLSYTVPGFWDPLRQEGKDYVVWSPGQLRQAGHIAFDQVSIKFVLPWEAHWVRIAENHDYGKIEAELTNDGETEVQWSSGKPVAPRYEWTITAKFFRNTPV